MADHHYDSGDIKLKYDPCWNYCLDSLKASGKLISTNMHPLDRPNKMVCTGWLWLVSDTFSISINHFH